MDWGTVAGFTQAGAAIVAGGAAIYLGRKTAQYVRSTRDIAEATREQAQASVAMAQEMREQRRASIMPAISIEQGTSLGMELLEAAAAGMNRVPCRLRNDGFGPALNVCANQYDKVNRNLGTFPRGHSTESMWLLLEDGRQVKVTYSDAAGTKYSSHRTADPNGALGPLIIQVEKP